MIFAAGMIVALSHLAHEEMDELRRRNDEDTT
jgi:hypothetical protein